MKTYHTYKDDEADWPEMQSFEYRGHMGDVVDVGRDKIPEYWLDAEGIYSDLPFPKGYDIFIKRAGKRGSMLTYLQGVSRLVNIFEVPTFLTGAKTDLIHLQAQRMVKIQLNNAAWHGLVWCGIWNSDLKPDSQNDIFDYFKQRSHTMLDFSCGYLSIMERLLPDCRLIVGDVNPRCIGAAYERIKDYYEH